MWDLSIDFIINWKMKMLCYFTVLVKLDLKDEVFVLKFNFIVKLTMKL